MRVPEQIARCVLSGHSIGFACNPDGLVTDGFEAGWGGGAYPPPGYLPWNILDVGNGDTYGYYWPIGKEAGPPIVCTIMHDAWYVQPVASGLAECIRLHLSTGHPDVEQLVEAAKDFGIPIHDIRLRNEDDEDAGPHDPPNGIEFRSVPSVETLLSVDPASPHLRYVAAKEAMAKRQLPLAEEHLKGALNVLPEYSDALALLVQVCRQQQNARRTAEVLMETITSPLCFGARERRKLLNWLQRMPDDAYPDCVDPLWQRRSQLTFAEAVKENDDYRVFEQLLNEYHRIGMGVRAVRLRLLTGELMGHETVSFRERYAWTGEKFRSLLTADLERAGLHCRLVAV